ncbi:adenosine deaminase [Arthrobacter sp. zg-Y411]|uniref:adenosine deaminase n=1 Tax=Arthrobacter zhangbolii TaxID=2886936 RepID=UPI001D15D745|nr:adenosine deaminase [Arthrobacter zhangbolii]MCC3293266.1 adenosine deaminase [Arthrobacter zhangbolii]
MPTTPALSSTPPCAELHLHIEGTLEPELIFELAGRNGITLPYASLEELKARYRFTDLQSFLDLYYANMDVLRTEADFADMTRAYLRRAAAAGVRHVEMMMDPQAHLVRGIPLETSVRGVCAALAASEEEFGISTALIAAFLRDRPAEEALDVLEDLLAMEAPIIGIGLDSAEVGNPPEAFIGLYRRAREAGLRTVAHAGEEGPSHYIEQALDLLLVDRIDHGIRCLDDPELVQRLVHEKIPLTICPLSNVRLQAVDSLAAHPLPQMLEHGLNISVNSDDPAYFGGYADDNFRAVQEAFGLDRAQLGLLAANSIEASFAPPGRRAELLHEVRRWEASGA